MGDERCSLEIFLELAKNMKVVVLADRDGAEMAVSFRREVAGLQQLQSAPAAAEPIVGEDYKAGRSLEDPS
jgi:hypothetical protein